MMSETKTFDNRVSVTQGDNGVAEVRLSRPDKMNALDPAMFEAIIAAGQHLCTAPGVRAVVLSGEGKAFCAGIDITTFGDAGKNGGQPITARTHGNTNIFQEVAFVWRRVPAPVIAAIHGVCFGGGMQIASGADIRIVHPQARMAIMEMKWGLVPDMAGYPLWRGLVRDDILRELVYTNREFSGAEAQGLGLATYIDEDPLARALAMANEIADRNPQAIRAAKRLSNAMHDEDTDALLMAESEEQGAIIRQPNQVEAVMAGMQKRKAVFKD